MKVHNIKKFEKWLKSVLKNYNDNYEPYLDELLHQFVSNGSTNYEIGSRETKSKKPECYSYEIKLHYYNDNGEEMDPMGNEHGYAEIEFIL